MSARYNAQVRRLLCVNYPLVAVATMTVHLKKFVILSPTMVA